MSSLHNKCLLHQRLTTARSHRPSSRDLLARRNLPVVAQSYKGNEGRSSGNIVDENMCILNRRMEEIRIAERLQRYSPAEQGWNYGPEYHEHKGVPYGPEYHEHKRVEEIVMNFLDLIGYFGGAFSIPILGGTLILCLTSLVVHLNDL